MLDLLLVVVLDDGASLDQSWLKTKDHSSLGTHEELYLRLELAPYLIVILRLVSRRRTHRARVIERVLLLLSQ